MFFVYSNLVVIPCPYVVLFTIIIIIIIIIIINNQVLRKIKIAVESDVKNWAYISLR